jgi:hypothetical protein
LEEQKGGADREGNFIHTSATAPSVGQRGIPANSLLPLSAVPFAAPLLALTQHLAGQAAFSLALRVHRLSSFSLYAL